MDSRNISPEQALFVEFLQRKLYPPRYSLAMWRLLGLPSNLLVELIIILKRFRSELGGVEGLHEFVHAGSHFADFNLANFETLKSGLPSTRLLTNLTLVRASLFTFNFWAVAILHSNMKMPITESPKIGIESCFFGFSRGGSPLKSPLRAERVFVHMQK